MQTIMLFRGIVIKKTDVGEYNQMVTLYTREFGKIAGLAKSVKKPSSKQAGHLDIFNLVDFLTVPGKSQPIIRSAQSVETFGRLKSSLTATSAGFFLLEAFDRLVYEEEKDAALWQFLASSFYKLNGSHYETDAKNLLPELKSEFLSVLGYSRNMGKRDADQFLESLGRRKFLSLQPALLNIWK